MLSIIDYVFVIWVSWPFIRGRWNQINARHKENNLWQYTCSGRLGPTESSEGVGGHGGRERDAETAATVRARKPTQRGGAGAELPPLTHSPLLRQQWREAPVSPEVQTPEALHGLQQAVLQAAVPQQQGGQVSAVCLPADSWASAQASQSPPRGAVGIGSAEGGRRWGLGGKRGVQGAWSPVVPHRRRSGAAEEREAGWEVEIKAYRCPKKS